MLHGHVSGDGGKVGMTDRAGTCPQGGRALARRAGRFNDRHIGRPEDRRSGRGVCRGGLFIVGAVPVVGGVGFRCCLALSRIGQVEPRAGFRLWGGVVSNQAVRQVAAAANRKGQPLRRAAGRLTGTKGSPKSP